MSKNRINSSFAAKDFQKIEEDLNFHDSESLASKEIIYLLNKSDTYKAAKKTLLTVSSLDPKAIVKLKAAIIKSLA